MVSRGLHRVPGPPSAVEMVKVPSSSSVQMQSASRRPDLTVFCLMILLHVVPLPRGLQQAMLLRKPYSRMKEDLALETMMQTGLLCWQTASVHLISIPAIHILHLPEPV